MPIPFLVGAAIAGLAGYGAKKSYDAHCDNEEAEEVNEEAMDIMEYATDKANKARQASNDAVQRLGGRKISVLEGSIRDFVSSFSRLKNIDFSRSEGLDELSKLKLNQEFIAELENMQSVASALAGGAAGGAALGAVTAFGAYGATMTLATASTGTAISALSGAAATNATLAWLGGGAIAAGGGGIALGTAVLGGLVAAPALAVFGAVASSKAAARLDEAYSNLAKANEYEEEMDTVVSLCDGIRVRANMFAALLDKLDPMLASLTYDMQDIISSKGTDYRNFSAAEKQIIAETAAAAVAVKAVLDTPILTEEGELTEESRQVADKTELFIESRDY